ncbi:MAG: M56 family metallopeptidase [Lachnospiraceae bacterium]
MIYASPIRRSFDATLLILFILLTRKLFGKKLNPGILRISWIFVALRLLIPVQFPVFDSLYTKLQLPGSCEYLEQLIKDQTFGFLLDLDYDNATGVSVSDFRQTIAEICKFLNQYFFTHSLEDLLVKTAQAGSLIFLSLFILQNIIFYAHIRKHSSIYGIKNNLPVYIIDDYSGSCLTGIANPQIYVSQMALSNVKWCQWIVKHELGHYQSKDNWYNLFSNICLILQWYNPLIWCAAHAALEDCEIACDHRILKDANQQECTEYGKCLIEMAAGGSGRRLHSAAAVSHLGKISLKRRILQIASRTDTTVQTMTGSYIFIFTIIILFLLCIMGG